MSYGPPAIFNGKNILIATVVCLGGLICGISFLVSAPLVLAVVAYVGAVVFFQNRLKELFYIYLFGVFFFPATIGIDTPFLLLNVDRMVLAVLLGSWALTLAKGRRVLVPSMAGKGILVYFLASAGSVILNYSYISSEGLLYSSLLKLFALFVERTMLIYLLLSIIQDKKEIKHILVFIVLCLSVVAAYGIYESKTHFNIFTKFTTIDRVAINRTVLSENLRVGMYRAKSTLALPHVLGTTLCMMFPTALYVFMGSRGRTRAGAALAALLFAGGIMATYTRGVYLALGLAIAISFFYIRSPFKKIVLVFLMVAALAMASVHPSVRLFYSQYLSRLLNSSQMTHDRENSVQARLTDYEYTAQRLKRHPFVGRGVGTHMAGHGGMPYLDNTYLYVLIETGFLGFIGFMWILYELVIQTGLRIRTRLRTDSDASLMLYLHIGIVVFYFQCLTYDAFSLGGASKLFWVIAGLLLTYLRLSEKKAVHASA